MHRSRLPLVSICAGLLASACFAQEEYRAPDGAFTLSLPARWDALSQEMAEHVTITVATPRGKDSPQLTVLSIGYEAGFDPSDREGTPNQVIELFLGLIEDSCTVEAFEPTAAVLGGLESTLVEAHVTDRATGDKADIKLWVVLGGAHALALVAEAAPDDRAGMAEVEAVAATLVAPGARPAEGATPAEPPASGLGGIAARIREGFREGDADATLVAGAPALTEGSVRNFARLLTAVFDVHLTEAEYALTKERFIHFYTESDPQGRATIAQTAGGILEQLRTLPEAERAGQIAEVRAVFEDRLSAGAQAGIEWAEVLWTAVERRRGSVAEVAEQPEGAEGDFEVSEADLDAATEMLYFMWVASGRDPSAATPEVVAQVRQYLAASFPQLPTELQLLLANSEKVYGQMRNAWANADDQERAVYAAQFGQALDQFGLGLGGGNGGGGGGSAWDDVAGQDPSEISAGLVQTTCYNLAQKSTGGW